MRIEVYHRSVEDDPRTLAAKKRLGSLVSCKRLVIADVFLVEGLESSEEEGLRRVFHDPITQRLFFGSACHHILPDWNLAFEISYKAGVTDTLALTVEKALRLAFPDQAEKLRVQTATLYVLESHPIEMDRQAVSRQFYNPLIQDVIFYEAGRNPSWRLAPNPPRVFQTPQPDIIPILDLTREQLVELSQRRLLALTADEMRVIQEYYSQPDIQAKRKSAGMDVNPTDVELEMLAQSWSEHCKHKIFQARIHYDDGSGMVQEIDSLFKTYIQKVTAELEPDKPFLRSVFRDNSGVIALDDDTLVCFKVETHNSPSALDPYGGAMTGIVGVNRDILGTGLGAKPIWNTDVLCFAPPDTPAGRVPTGLLPPSRILEGVHRGIVEGGNHSGIPTVAGAFLFDESYIGKPLVFCGTGGLLPATIDGRPAYQKKVNPGSYAVVCGGRVGKDGIHGATFSSLALDETSPTSAVQIGDPIIQKIMTDFLLEARDLGLYEALTDNGAGGLSSSLGEMAQDSGGLRIDLDACPLKYPGLAAWEIWVSESQERMSLSVPPQHWPALEELARRRGVEIARLGEFTDSGWIEIFHGGHRVGLLSMDFVHHGLPQMNLVAVWSPAKQDRVPLEVEDPRGLLLAILAEPNVASKEELVRQYDHEVQGRSYTKPQSGLHQDGPSDGAVLRLHPGSPLGITVTHGICPRVGDADTRAMAACAVDEAYRAHIALGGDPDHAAILDNFCWPDPVQGPKTPDGPHKLAQLVRACEGLKEAALAYRLPIISGKDSMKNDAWAEGRKISVRPTLLISLVGRAEVSKDLPDTDFLKAGDWIVLLGRTRRHLAGSMAERVLGKKLEGIPYPDFQIARDLYHRVHRGIREGLFCSVHDLSDGGLAIALAESCLGGRLGAEIDLRGLCPSSGLSPAEVLFSETPSRFLVSVRSEDRPRLEELFGKEDYAFLGVTTARPLISIQAEGVPILKCSLDEILAAWKSWEGRWS